MSRFEICQVDEVSLASHGPLDDESVPAPFLSRTGVVAAGPRLASAGTGFLESIG